MRAGPHVFASPLPRPPTMIGIARAGRATAPAAATAARTARGQPRGAVPFGPHPWQRGHPLEAEVLDRGRVDELQRAVSLAA